MPGSNDTVLVVPKQIKHMDLSFNALSFHFKTEDIKSSLRTANQAEWKNVLPFQCVEYCSQVQDVLDLILAVCG